MGRGWLLSGELPVVLMQNSGLGLSLNAIASLVIPFEIGMLYIISVRGYDDKDTVENKIMGSLTMTLLNDLKIESKILQNDNCHEIAGWAKEVVTNGNCASIFNPNIRREEGWQFLNESWQCFCGRGAESKEFFSYNGRQ